MPEQRGRSSRGFVLMVMVALAIRLSVMAFVYQERIDPDREYWRFGGETGRIARSIVEGHGYSSPLRGDTGPTAWMPPVYPLLLAGVFKAFGVYTKASALAVLSIDCLFSALTCIPVFLIARRKFGHRAAVVAGWTWAFFPYAIYFSANFIWPTTLSTLLLSLIFLAALRLESSSSGLAWMVFGALCGFSALNDPVVLTVAVPVAAWMVFRLWLGRLQWAIPTAAAILAFGLTVSPWFIRNYEVFHAVIPFRDNGGLELYTGNTGNTWHFAPGGFHPSDSDQEWAEFKQSGELKYMAHKREQGLAFISAHPTLFVETSLRRALYMWTSYWSFGRRYLAEEPMDPFNILLCTSLTILAGIGLWRGFRRDALGTMPFALALFCFPMIYYVTHPQDYFRRPIDPIFVVLAVYAVTQWRADRRLARETPPVLARAATMSA